MKLGTKIVNQFIKFLLRIKGLIMIIKYMNAFEPLLGTELSDSSKEIKGLMAHS